MSAWSSAQMISFRLLMLPETLGEWGAFASISISCPSVPDTDSVLRHGGKRTNVSVVVCAYRDSSWASMAGIQYAIFPDSTLRKTGMANGKLIAFLSTPPTASLSRVQPSGEVAPCSRASVSMGHALRSLRMHGNRDERAV